MATFPQKHTVVFALEPSGEECSYATLFEATKRTTVTGIYFKTTAVAQTISSKIFWCIAVSSPWVEESEPIIGPTGFSNTFKRPRDILHADYASCVVPRFKNSFEWFNGIVVAEAAPVCKGCEQKLELDLPPTPVTDSGTVATRRQMEPGDRLYVVARSNATNDEGPGPVIPVQPYIEGLITFFTLG